MSPASWSRLNIQTGTRSGPVRRTARSTTSREFIAAISANRPLQEIGSRPGAPPEVGAQRPDLERTEVELAAHTREGQLHACARPPAGRFEESEDEAPPLLRGLGGHELDAAALDGREGLRRPPLP